MSCNIYTHNSLDLSAVASHVSIWGCGWQSPPPGDRTNLSCGRTKGGTKPEPQWRHQARYRCSFCKIRPTCLRRIAMDRIAFWVIVSCISCISLENWQTDPMNLYDLTHGKLSLAMKTQHRCEGQRRAFRCHLSQRHEVRLWGNGHFYGPPKTYSHKNHEFTRFRFTTQKEV